MGPLSLKSHGRLAHQFSYDTLHFLGLENVLSSWKLSLNTVFVPRLLKLAYLKTALT